MKHAIAKLVIPTVPTLLSILSLGVMGYLLKAQGIGYEIIGPFLLLGVVFSSVFVEGIQGYYTALGITLASWILTDGEDLGEVLIFSTTTIGVSFCIARLKYLRYKAHLQSERAEILYQLSRDLTRKNGRSALLTSTIAILQREVRDELHFYLAEGKRILQLDGNIFKVVDEHLRTLPDWVCRTGEPAGRGTAALAGAEALFLPVGTLNKRFGAISIQFKDPADYYDTEKRKMYETIAKQIAEALERDQEAEYGYQHNLAQEGEKLRNSLLRSLSHDLRTPLTGIQGSIELVKMKVEDTQDRETHELLDSVSEELAWLGRMMDNILSLTRFESERVILRKEAESVEDVVGSAVRALSKRLAQHPLEISLPDSILMVPMESALIEQVLVNLIDNASKYSDPGMPISITVTVENGMAVFTVADRGKGIALQDVGRIFEKFERGNPEAVRGIRGTGLGLSICRAIIEAHDGTIEAIPREGGGTVFLFSLPLEVASYG